jgi:alpha-beta hydrolase superfamily lysophospholipase
MQTKLVEFKNQEKETLRGILTVPDRMSETGTIFLQGFEGDTNAKNRAVSLSTAGADRWGMVYLQGFERNTTVEKKSKLMAGALAQKDIVSLRYDSAGCGLSDGDFSKTTLEKRSRELLKAIEILQKESGVSKINISAHSLGMCPLALVFDQVKPLVNKMIFVAPALNQKDLMRFYFVRDSMKRNDPGLAIVWDNYKQYLDEEAFLADCRRTGRMVRENYIAPEYFLEAKDMDFSHSFDSVKENILHVHGERDMSVPLESLSVEFPSRIIVKGGDHDLERPDFWEQWFPQAVEFLTK